MQHDAIEVVAHDDLAAQSAGWLGIKQTVEHVCFQLTGLAGFFGPVRAHEHMAGCAGTTAAAISQHSLHTVIDSGLHEVCTALNLDNGLFAGEIDIGYLWHFLLLHKIHVHGGYHDALGVKLSGLCSRAIYSMP